MRWMEDLPYPDHAVDPLAWEEDGNLVGVLLMCHKSLAWGEVERFYCHLGEHSGIVGLRVVAAPDLVAELRARKGL